MAEYPLASYSEFPWHEFYFDEASQTATFCLFGASRSGKTTLIEAIWRSFFKKHITVMFLDNPKAPAYDWARRQSKKIILCQGLGSTGRTIIDMARYIQASVQGKFHWLFIIDDVLSIHNSTIVNELLMSLRNMGLSSILSIQDVKMLSVAQRNNCNNILCGYANTPVRRRAIVEEVVGKGIVTEGQYAKLTRDHGWLCRNCVMDGPWFHIRLDLTLAERDEKEEPPATGTLVVDITHPEEDGDVRAE